MKLFIPEIGTKLTLIKDWTFKLYPERRNESIATKYNYRYWYRNSESEWVHNETGETKTSLEITMAAGSELTISRIYIRQGLSKYSSITFNCKKGKYAKTRFWAKLDECNNIECSVMNVKKTIELNIEYNFTSLCDLRLDTSIKPWVKNKLTRVDDEFCADTIVTHNNEPLAVLKLRYETNQWDILLNKRIEAYDTTGKHLFTYKSLQTVKQKLKKHFSE